MARPTYEQFVEKFKTKKTTDDCYTPELVYKAVSDWELSQRELDLIARLGKNEEPEIRTA